MRLQTACSRRESSADLDWVPDMVNEWDFIRYGTIADGELIVAAVPPAGIISHEQASGVTTILATFDGPNHVYVDDIAVVATSGVAPNVVATRRLDNGAPETVEIVLDRELPRGATTTFTFTDASGAQTIEYTRLAPDIPAAWGLVVLCLACLIAGAIMFRGADAAPSRGLQTARFLGFLRRSKSRHRAG